MKKIKVAPGTIALFLGISLLNNINGGARLNTEYAIQEITTNNLFNDDNDIDVLSSLDYNQNITTEEKNKIYRLQDLINENPYLDKLSAFYALENLKIEYNSPRPSNMKDNVVASYTLDNDTINVYGSMENTTDDVLLHEVVHALFFNKKTINLPQYFREGMTELLVDEYISSNPYIEDISYPFEVNMIKILCELVGEDKVLQAFSLGDMNIIKNELIKNTSEEYTDEFLNNLDNVFISYENDRQIDNDKFNQITSYLDSYFNMIKENNDTKKYNNYLYYRGIMQLFNSDYPIELYNIYIDNYTYPKEIYFSQKLKNNLANYYVKKLN